MCILIRVCGAWSLVSGSVCVPQTCLCVCAYCVERPSECTKWGNWLATMCCAGDPPNCLVKKIMYTCRHTQALRACCTARRSAPWLADCWMRCCAQAAWGGVIILTSREAAFNEVYNYKAMYVGIIKLSVTIIPPLCRFWVLKLKAGEYGFKNFGCTRSCLR